MTVAEDLDTIADNWPALRDMLGGRPTTTWPPAMGVSRLLDDQERAERAAERADTAPDAPGPRPVPVDVDVLDTMTAVTAELVDLADQLAARIQRPVLSLSVTTGQGWTDDLHRAAVLLTAQDSADVRRWRYVGQRTVSDAAEWIAARYQASAGPFRPLTEGERARVEQVAAGGAARVRRALGLARRTTPAPYPCPACRGSLVVEGGDGEPPAVRCEEDGCGWSRMVRSDAAA